MSIQTLLDQCLAILYSIKDDKQHLERLLEFMQQEFCEDHVDTAETINHIAQVPERYHAAIREIADNMGAQFISFVNLDTLEVDAVPQNVKYVEGELFSAYEWEDRIEIEPLNSHDSYEIMGNFVAQLPNSKEKKRLSDAINGYKPFANFNRIIHQSDLRENWFEFRQKELEKIVIDDYLYKILEKA
jgi:hypothetical protein